MRDAVQEYETWWLANTGHPVNWFGIPQYMRGGVARYLLQGIPPGSFLQAVFSNDLMSAAGKADDTNIQCLAEYAKFLYNCAPTISYGSKEIVKAWRGVLENASNA
jgi:hypothetical protein